MNSKSIAIVGGICSGKSTLADLIHDITPNSLSISFGDYLKKYCIDNDIECNRNVLQNLGQQFIEKDSEKFLKDVIAFANPAKDQCLIFEGVRHISIFKAIINYSSEFRSIYLDVEAERRYKRYISRDKDIDIKISYDEFLRKDSHLVELEIESLKSQCGLILRSDLLKNYRSQVELYISS